MTTILEAQKDVCKRFGATHFASKDNETVHFAVATKGLLPVNGERIRGADGECGWYVWCGSEKHQQADFFQKISVFELSEAVPLAHAFLGLPPGFKFLIAGGHQRAWLDDDLLTQVKAQAKKVSD